MTLKPYSVYKDSGIDWLRDVPKNWRERALYPEDVLTWLQDTQAPALEKLTKLHGKSAESILLDRLVKVLDAKDGSTI